jgi:hypothetical protein
VIGDGIGIGIGIETLIAIESAEGGVVGAGAGIGAIVREIGTNAADAVNLRIGRRPMLRIVHETKLLLL